MAKKIMVGGLWERGDVVKLKTLAILTGRTQLECLRLLVRTATVAEPDLRTPPLAVVDDKNGGV